jgi:hypothetical protein
MPVIPCLLVPTRILLCRAYLFLPVPTRSYPCLVMPTRAYRALSCRAYPCLSVPTHVVPCVSVSYRACSCLFVSCLHVSCLVVCRARVVPCFVSWCAVLGPLNRACRVVSKMKKISHATFKNTTRDTCCVGTDRHAYRAVSLSCRFVSCHALTHEHDFITLGGTSQTSSQLLGSSMPNISVIPTPQQMKWWQKNDELVVTKSVPIHEQMTAQSVTLPANSPFGKAPTVPSQVLVPSLPLSLSGV